MNFLFIFLLPTFEISTHLKHNLKIKNTNLKYYNTVFPILKSDSLHHLSSVPKIMIWWGGGRVEVELGEKREKEQIQHSASKPITTENQNLRQRTERNHQPKYDEFHNNHLWHFYLFLHLRLYRTSVRISVLKFCL